ncbi:hypothetical protein B4168_2212 [Anoxybacillus flavithermus]|nr:hypothetical protein B4168_2212 [Anoxybacillus flavithermus]OAO85867.1 hypothetical protein GT23_2770 [Parageobacillus thermoglucosidasius]
MAPSFHEQNVALPDRRKVLHCRMKRKEDEKAAPQSKYFVMNSS